jgi:2-C-methyl-D-erythritol 4-phosphate cytidylyltransferase
MSVVGLVIPAGGAGQRLGGRAKAELPLAGKPMLQWTLAPFLSIEEIQHIVIALPATLLASPPDWLRDKRISLVQGGAERSESVRAGLSALPPDVDIVVIHDAARPLVRVELIREVLDAACAGSGAIAALPATDTIHVVDDELRIVQTPDRNMLWQAQTPQVFPRSLIEAAHRRAAGERWSSTDDAALVVRCGGMVQIVKGDAENLKITVPRDIEVAEALLSRRS